jgi:hypothetical protein
MGMGSPERKPLKYYKRGIMIEILIKFFIKR